jgi:hypothetical protein
MHSEQTGLTIMSEFLRLGGKEVKEAKRYAHFPSICFITHKLNARNQIISASFHYKRVNKNTRQKQVVVIPSPVFCFASRGR